MKRKSFCFGLIAFFVPLICCADGLFYWSPYSSGGQPEEVIYHDNNANSLEPFSLFLYYKPGQQNVSDGFSLDLNLSSYEILDAEVYNFAITVAGSKIGQRWDNLGDITIDGYLVSGFSGASSSNFGGLRLSNTGTTGPFFDEGYDSTAEAFLIGSVTLQGVYGQVEYVSVEATDEGADVFPETQASEITSGCLLDPPYGGFENSYQLPDDSGIAAGIYHCTSQPFDVCDGTIWNRFEPKAEGLFTCNTFRSAIVDTQLEIYSGEMFEQLELIATVDDVAGTTKSRVSFPVSAGVRYSIRIVSNPVQLAPSLMEYEFLEGVAMGDVNGDGEVNLLDVLPFIEVVTAGEYQPAADVNSDGEVNLLDVAAFVDLLTQP